MSTETPEQQEMGTKPIKEHAWLQKLVGEWRIESEMATEPGAEKMHTKGTASTVSLGGLWAYTTTNDTMPDGKPMISHFAIGYDVSFKEYRACWIGSVSSHLWTYTGTLSADEKTMTLDCKGPSMIKNGETATYRDIMELIDDNHRVVTSYLQGDDGGWEEFMTSHYYRV